MKFSGPKILLQIEGLVALVAASIFYQRSGASWKEFALLFLAPDLSMIGYAFGKSAGARLYNAGHTYMTPFLLFLIAYFAQQPSLLPLSLIWTAHIGFDRLLGYGLKYETAFKDTHLGRV